MKRLPLLLAALLSLGCASTGEKIGPVADTLCSIARTELARCDSGALLDARRCRAAESAAIVCSIGGRTPESGIIAGLRPGVGLTPRSLQTCWRTFPGGPQRFGIGRLDVDPFDTAGMPGAPMGALPCEIPAVNEAYRAAFGQPCLGEGAALGGYCGGPSNEVLRGAPPKLEWACRNRPDLLNSSGPAEWSCSPGGLDLLRLAAHVGGTQMMAAIDLAMGNGPPAPVCGNGIKEAGETCATCPADVANCPRCGDHRPDPGETCANCPQDLGPCPDGKADCSSVILPAPGAPQWVAVLSSVASTGLVKVAEIECRGGTVSPPTPACIPAAQKATACACKGLRESRKAACVALCSWASGLSTC